MNARIIMEAGEIFSQEKLNETLELNIVFSANIIYKVINNELVVGKSCLGNWLESLNDKEITMLANYFNQLRGEKVEEEESKDLIAEDLISCIDFLYFLECGNFDNFDGEKISEMLELLDIVCNLDILRREDKVDILERSKISDEKSGSFRTKKA